ncbi:methyl-accepting chemotaxis protein [Pseudooceanicola sp.]|uniref:methyl-accepting chemotaxis protein n=1 Tax=Pseudooceanicola sp. TaxID=1914328 RepID=UPI0035C78640
MQRLKALSLSKTVFLAISLPTAIAILLGALVMSSGWGAMRDAARIERQMDLSVALGAVIHEQQRERGKSSVFLNSGGTTFGPELAEQRQATDTALNRLRGAYATTAATLPPEIASIVNALLTQEERLPEIRSQVDAQTIPLAEALGYYTANNARAIEAIGLIGAATRDPKISSELSGFSAFLIAKERAGIERAIGSGMFAAKDFSLPRQLHLQRLISQQDLALDVYRQHATPAGLDRLNRLEQGPIAAGLATLRALAFAPGGRDTAEVTAEDYFQAATDRITELKAMEDWIAREIQADAAALSRQKLTFVLLLLGLTTLSLGTAILLSYLSCKSALGSVMQVVRTADTMAKGDLESEVPRVATPEVRRIAHALERLRDNILDARAKAAAENAAGIAARDAAAREREAHHAAEQARLEKDRLDAEETRQAEQAIAAEISRVVAACASGDFSQRLEAEGQTGILGEICEGLNRIGTITNEGLGAVQIALDHLAEGDLTYRMSEGYSGVFSEIAQKVNATSQSVGTSLGTILTSAVEIESSAGEVSDAATDLAQRSENNAASLEESAAALHQMSVAVSNSTEASNQVRAQVLAIADRAKSGNMVVQETVEAMQKIHDSSSRIENTLKLIEDIAHQTNLLALNAGVEAARAGEAGRGFAVVATEVRGLARRSADAAAEISDIVAASSSNVRLGVEKAQRSGAELEEIVTGIGSVVTRIEEVTTAAGETDLGIQEVSRATEDLESNTQKNVAMFEETTAAIRVLRGELASLVAAGSTFRIPDRLTAPPPLRSSVAIPAPPAAEPARQAG